MQSAAQHLDAKGNGLSAEQTVVAHEGKTINDIGVIAVPGGALVAWSKGDHHGLTVQGVRSTGAPAGPSLTVSGVGDAGRWVMAATRSGAMVAFNGQQGAALQVLATSLVRAD